MHPKLFFSKHCDRNNRTEVRSFTNYKIYCGELFTFTLFRKINTVKVVRGGRMIKKSCHMEELLTETNESEK